MSVFDYSEAMEATAGDLDDVRRGRLRRYRDALGLDEADVSVREGLEAIGTRIGDFL